MAPHNSDYSNGKIYKIINDQNSTEYIGSTCQTLQGRFYCHKSHAKTGYGKSNIYNAMRELGISKFSIVLIKLFACASKTELEVEEYRLAQERVDGSVPLYNEKMSNARTEASKLKQRIAMMRRGYVTYIPGRYCAWRFCFTPALGVRSTISFTIKKYGQEGAYLLAVAEQDKQYPRE